MVLWEITLGTAYFLGLKRTYKLALRIQRRLVTPKYPKIRQFLHRKTRSIFDAAIKVHREVQQRDIEVGRNLGNWILRWLDKMKPGAQIRPGKPTQSNNNSAVKTTQKQLPDSSSQKPPQNYGTSYTRNGDRESNRHLFTSTKSWHAAYPTISMMMKPAKPVGINTHYRRFISGLDTFELRSTRFGLDRVIRNDIYQWMMKN